MQNTPLPGETLAPSTANIPTQVTVNRDRRSLMLSSWVQLQSKLVMKTCILTTVTETLKINNNAIGNKLTLFSCLKHSYLKKKLIFIFYNELDKKRTKGQRATISWAKVKSRNESSQTQAVTVFLRHQVISKGFTGSFYSDTGLVLRWVLQQLIQKDDGTYIQ